MRRALGILAALCLLFAAPAVAQQPVESEAPIAWVGDRVITEMEFKKWLRNARRSSASNGRPADPPPHVRCRKQTSVERCARRYASLRRQVMQFLLQAAWVFEEAEAQGISVSSATVRRRFEAQRREAFPNLRDYRKFLRRTGSSEEDILYRVELDILQSRLAARVTASAGEPTPDEVTRYVARHRRQLRNLRRQQARRRARRVLGQQREAKALMDFIEGFRKRSRAKTVCIEGYVVPECGNAPVSQARK